MAVTVTNANNITTVTLSASGDTATPQNIINAGFATSVSRFVMSSPSSIILRLANGSVFDETGWTTIIGDTRFVQIDASYGGGTWRKGYRLGQKVQGGAYISVGTYGSPPTNVLSPDNNLILGEATADNEPTLQWHNIRFDSGISSNRQPYITAGSNAIMDIDGIVFANQNQNGANIDVSFNLGTIKNLSIVRANSALGGDGFLDGFSVTGLTNSEVRVAPLTQNYRINAFTPAAQAFTEFWFNASAVQESVATTFYYLDNPNMPEAFSWQTRVRKYGRPAVLDATRRLQILIRDADGNQMTGIRIYNESNGNVLYNEVLTDDFDEQSVFWRGTWTTSQNSYILPDQSRYTDLQTIYLRKYGYVYEEFNFNLREQEASQPVFFREIPFLLSAVAVDALTSVSLDHTNKIVTISGDANTVDLFSWYLRQLETETYAGNPLEWDATSSSIDVGSWDVVIDGVTYTGDMTTTGTITLANGANFIGTRTDTNGTIAPPKTASITGLVSGSRLRIYNNTKATEVYNAVVNDTSYTATYEEDGDYSEGDTVNIRVTYVSGSTAKLGFTVNAVVGSSGWSALVEQQDDSVYNSFEVDGSTITQFSADYINDQVDVIVGSNFYLSNFYAWWVYNLTTEDGIRDFFGGIEASDQANFEIKTNILSLYLDNSTSTNIRQLDNRRLFRSDGAYPVLDQTTGGGGIDVVWRNQILIAETGVSGLTSSESALLNDISTLATSTQLTSAQSAIQSDIAALNDVSASDVWAAATRSLTDKAGFTLTANERSAIATAVEQSILDENDGQQVLNAIVGAIGNTNVDEVALVAAIRADLERNAGKLDAIDTATAAMETKAQADTRQAALIQAHGTTQTAIENLNDLDANAIHNALDSYTNKGDWKADISALATQLSIDNLNDLSVSDIDARLASYDAPTLAEMTAAFAEIKGSSWSETDTLEAIRNAVTSGSITAADVWTYATREVTGGTIDTNNDMRGTDNAALETDLRVVNENVQKASLLIPATEDI